MKPHIGVKLFASRDNLSEMLSYSDVDLESIGEKPTAVFIVIQDEKKTYHSLVTILLKQIYETLISTAQRHGGKLPVRTNFLLDEFANMPPLKDVTTMITAARSRRIRFTMIIQNFAQLDSVYGKEDAETIRGNCGNIIYLITTELKALEEISKMCGEVKSKKDDKTASTPLVTVSDLQRMKPYEVIILRMRKQPFKTKVTPNYKLDWGRKYPKASYPNRKKRDVQTFDIKEFVKAKKKAKLLEMMNSSKGEGDDSPFRQTPPGMRSMGMNPFDNPMGNPFERSMSNPFERPMVNPFERSMGNPFGNQSINPLERQSTSPIGQQLPNPFENSQLTSLVGEKSNSLDVNKENDKIQLPDAKIVVENNKENVETSTTKPIVSIHNNNSSSTNNNLGFDVDELVRKIDAKIAELEEEERREKEKQQQSSPVVEKSPTEDKDNKAEVIAKPQEVSLQLQDEEDDDNFFDDFFDN